MTHLWLWITLGIFIFILLAAGGGFLLWWFVFRKKPSSPPAPTPLLCGEISPWIYSKQSGDRSVQGARILQYLKVLYPQSANFLNDVSDNNLISFYNGLHWYYLPLPAPIDMTRGLPLTSYDQNSETIYYMADGFDCGQYSSDSSSNSNGDFVCQVFSSCNQAEFDSTKALPYQCISFIKPYARREGFPSYSYVEAVDFPCETIGKMLENAPGCSSTSPSIPCNGNNRKSIRKKDISSSDNIIIINNRIKPSRLPNKTDPVGKNTCTCSEYQGDPTDCLCPDGCIYTDPDSGMTDTCCWDWDSNAPDQSVCTWPNMCSAYLSGSTVYNNYCNIPSWFEDFPTPDSDTTTNPTGDFVVGQERWMDWLNGTAEGNEYWVTDMIKGYGTTTQPAKPSLLDSGGTPTGVVPNPEFESSNKVMFYPRTRGYGKFINHGKTAIYYNYQHFFLTCPKTTPKGDTVRWFYPYILQVNQSNGGNTRFQEQLEALSNGTLTDKRYYLEGYVTTLKGAEYEGYKTTPGDGGGSDVIVLANTFEWGNCIENTNGLINPLDDDFLRFVDQKTICKYYPPSSQVLNPQYGETIKFTPQDSVALQAGSWIHGDGGADIFNRYFNEDDKQVYVLKDGYFDSSITTYGQEWPIGTWPFGVYFGGANLGGPAYDVAEALGLDSLQLTQMPTGLGRPSYCVYPGYDEESVLFMTHSEACKQGFVLLNPFADANYVNYGFVWGSGDTDKDTETYSIIPIDATKMPLTVRNTPQCWQDEHNGLLNSNALYYEADPDATVDLYGTCPYKDAVLGN